MSTEPSRGSKNSPEENRLPFEPRQKRSKKSQTKPSTAPQKTASGQGKPPRATKEAMAIPEAVSKRMVQRMALLCGVPTFMGIATFFVSYLLITNFGLKLPNVAVVLVSMGFFGLGVLGLSYGLLSASWDEDTPGTKLGWQEFTTNWGRMTSAWRSARQKTSN